jgi:hypothetical protein
MPIRSAFPSFRSHITEPIMQLAQADPTTESRLRIVFDDAVISFSLAAEETLGEIARRLGDLSDQRHRKPVAVDITFRPRSGDRCAGRRVGRASTSA